MISQEDIEEFSEELQELLKDMKRFSFTDPAS
jgi:hypothetical protein